MTDKKETIIDGRVLHEDDVIHELVDVVEEGPGKVSGEGSLTPEMREIVSAMAEKVAREMFPGIAERIVREEIEKLKEKL